MQNNDYDIAARTLSCKGKFCLNEGNYFQFQVRFFSHKKGVPMIQRLGRRLQFSVCYKRGPNLRSLLRSDKVKLPIDRFPSVVYEVKCSCWASYIGETGFTLAHRFSQHMKHLIRYNKAKQELEETNTGTAHRGRPPSLPPLVAMERALAASAVAERAAHCSGSLQTRILCKEPQLSIRRIKEALYIQHNTPV
ncbi:hypothetical protein M514_02393 [Trichuris suis]|uniref:Uncharacterized protein n=1 Tax=Trichuris suis TaxID=68888 RepID=A0A085N5T5_9BILA|nr:hypothetical protein M514_02393 [Trichuris suis]